MICVIFKVYVHYSVEKRKDIFSVKEQYESWLNLQIINHDSAKARVISLNT